MPRHSKLILGSIALGLVAVSPITAIASDANQSGGTACVAGVAKGMQLVKQGQEIAIGKRLSAGPLLYRGPGRIVCTAGAIKQPR